VQKISEACNTLSEDYNWEFEVRDRETEARITNTEDHNRETEARIRHTEGRIRETEARIRAFFFFGDPILLGGAQKINGIDKIHTKRVYSFKFLYLRKSKTKQTFANLSKLGHKKEGLFRI
jgi:hypothetical protein